MQNTAFLFQLEVPFWEYNEGPTKCDPSITDVYFTLHLDASETKLIVGGIEHTILGLQVLHLHFDTL